jgi:hypothetical protein
MFRGKSVRAPLGSLYIAPWCLRSTKRRRKVREQLLKFDSTSEPLRTRMHSAISGQFTLNILASTWRTSRLFWQLTRKKVLENVLAY